MYMHHVIERFPYVLEIKTVKKTEPQANTTEPRDLIGCTNSMQERAQSDWFVEQSAETRWCRVCSAGCLRAVFSRVFIKRMTTTDVHLFISVQAFVDETKRK